MTGATKPMTAVSSPSMVTIQKHSTSTSHWYADILRSSINALMSTDSVGFIDVSEKKVPRPGLLSNPGSCCIEGEKRLRKIQRRRSLHRFRYPARHKECFACFASHTGTCRDL